MHEPVYEMQNSCRTSTALVLSSGHEEAPRKFVSTNVSTFVCKRAGHGAALVNIRP